MTIRGPQRRPRVVPISAPSFPTLPRPHLYRNIAYTFIGLTIFVMVGVLWFSSVNATITVHVKKQSIKIDETIEVARAPKQGQIPGRVVQGVFEKVEEINVKQLISAMASSSADAVILPPSGGTQKPTEPTQLVQARGTVKIINKYSRAQTLVKTTRLLTEDKKLYRIDKTINIPAGGETQVSVYADQTGSEFAIGPTKFTIPGLFVDLQKYIYAVSETAFSAIPITKTPATVVESEPKPGKKTSGTPITADMIAFAQKRVMDSVLAQGKQSLVNEMNDPRFGEVVYFVRLIEKKSNATAGQSTDTFLTSIKVDVTAVYHSKEDLMAFVRSRLRERIPDGRELIPLESQAVSLSLESADSKSETALIHAAVEGGYRLGLASPVLQKSVFAGKSKDDAISLLKTIEGIDDVRIDIKPRWVNTLPTLKDRIEVKVE